MGKHTKIDWCDATWNPVTGCLHGCEYCYARRIAERFGGASETHNNECCNECQWVTEGDGSIHELAEPVYDPDHNINAPYPFDFDPTFHKYLLDVPQHWRKPRTIFVCSMADLFGEWVPDEWIKQVFDACEKAPWHRYIFLTKNCGRYADLYGKDIMPRGIQAWNKYFGCTITKPSDSFFFNNLYGNGIDHPGFLSIEPIMDDFGIGGFNKDEMGIKWIIVGAETGNRKGKVAPKREWIEHMARTCRDSNVPIFMKKSLRGLMGEDFRQEFPWEVKK